MVLLLHLANSKRHTDSLLLKTPVRDREAASGAGVGARGGSLSTYLEASEINCPVPVGLPGSSIGGANNQIGMRERS